MAKQKIILYPYSKQFPKFFSRERGEIRKYLKDFSGFRIYHIGSTSVPGLGGKGIIDIMLAVKDWKKRKDIVAALKKNGFRHVHPEDKHRIFLSRIKRTKKGDTHLHLVKDGTKEMKKHLIFRNFLKRSKKARERYWNHKVASFKQTAGERLAFGKVKRTIVEELEKKAYSKLKN